MKSIYLILLLVFSIYSTPQDESQYTTAPDLIIIKSRLSSIVRVDVSPPDSPLSDNHSPRITRRHNPPEYEWHGKAELELQNNGSKSVKSIYWEFFLFVEGNSEILNRSYRIHSKKAIKPGQTVKITGWIKDTYLKELREQQKKGSLQGRAEIKRINYLDGGIWLPLKLSPKQPK
jgi:hypothetical protein